MYEVEVESLQMELRHIRSGCAGSRSSAFPPHRLAGWVSARLTQLNQQTDWAAGKLWGTQLSTHQSADITNSHGRIKKNMHRKKKSGFELFYTP